MGRKPTFSFAIIVTLIILVALFAALFYYVKSNVHYGDVYIPSENTAGGKVGVGVIIEYADGRIQQVDPSQIRYTLFPLTVYCSGEPVKKFTWVAYVYLDWQGDLTCLEIKGPMTVKSGDLKIRTENTWRKTGVNFNMPPKKDYVEIWRFSLDASEVEAAIGQSGTFKLTCTIDATATATFSTGITDTKTATASANIEITIQTGALTAMLVDIQASALRS